MRLAKEGTVDDLQDAKNNKTFIFALFASKICYCFVAKMQVIDERMSVYQTCTVYLSVCLLDSILYMFILQQFSMDPV